MHIDIKKQCLKWPPENGVNLWRPFLFNGDIVAPVRAWVIDIQHLFQFMFCIFRQYLVDSGITGGILQRRNVETGLKK